MDRVESLLLLVAVSVVLTATYFGYHQFGALGAAVAGVVSALVLYVGFVLYVTLTVPMKFPSSSHKAPALTEQEITQYLTHTNKHALAGVVSCVALTQFLTDKGKAMAAEGQIILLNHQGLFEGCSSGATIGAVINRIVERWPSVSTEERELLADVVIAHRSVMGGDS